MTASGNALAGAVLSTRAFDIMPDGGAIIAGSLLKPGTRTFTYLLALTGAAAFCAVTAGWSRYED